MDKKKKGLGKGLGALLSEANVEIKDKDIKEIEIRKIEPNPNQPRKEFDKDKLKQLEESIKRYGVVQPIMVKKKDDIYIIVAGERRWRAARQAGLERIPAVITKEDERTTAEISLIENLQREDLNPIEEAEGYGRLMKEYKLTQEKVAEAVGKSRPAITNSLRILNLPERIKKLISEGKLSEGHARTLLTFDDEIKAVNFANEIIVKGYSVRKAEELVKKPEKKEKIEKKKTKKDIEVERLERELKDILQTKVSIDNSREGKGKIILEFYSQDELSNLIEKIQKIKK